MAAMIEFVCVAEHERRSDPSVTLKERAWAYCSAGAAGDHKWVQIDPTAVEMLKSRPGNGVPHLAPDDSQKRTLADSPAR